MIKIIPAETSVQGLHLKECGGCEDCRPLHDHDQLALEREGQPRPSLEQHQGVHRSDGAGGCGQGEDVPGDHGGLPDLLGTSLPRHPGQLELGVEGRQEVDVSRGEGKVELAIHLFPDPKVSLHVAFVHSFVNPLLFVVLHKGCRWICSLKKVLAQTQARHPRSPLLQLLSVLGQGDSACLTPRCQVVEGSDGDDDDDDDAGYVDGAKAVIAP